MSAIVEDFNLLEELEYTSDFTHTYLDNDEFDTDTLDIAENEGSDTDACYSPLDNVSSKAEETEKRNARYERGLEEGSEDSDGESEITFLRLKVKLLMKESSEQYNKLLGRLAASEETVKTLVKINHSNREEQELDSNRWSPRSKDAQQARGLISPQLSELTNSLANLKWGFKKRENELLSQIEQYKKVTLQLHGSQKRLRTSLRSVCERICDGLVTAEQAVEATEEMNRDTLSEKQPLRGDMEKLQVVELKKRIKILEAKNTELTEMTQNFLEVENEVKEQLQKRQEGYERQKEELKNMQQQIKDDIDQKREKEESNNIEKKIREEEIAHLRSEVDELKGHLTDIIDDRDEAEQVIYKLNEYTIVLETRIKKLDDHVIRAESQRQVEIEKNKLNVKASEETDRLLVERTKAIHVGQESVPRSLSVEFLQLEGEYHMVGTEDQEKSMRSGLPMDNKKKDDDEGESDGSVSSYEETIRTINMTENKDGDKDAEEDERKRHLLSLALGIEHRISIAAHLDAVNEQIIERRAFKGGVESKIERGSYNLHPNGRAHSPSATRSPNRRVSPERIKNIEFAADVHIGGTDNLNGHDINGNRSNNDDSKSRTVGQTHESQTGSHGNGTRHHVDRSVSCPDDKAHEQIERFSITSIPHSSVGSNGGRFEGSLQYDRGILRHEDYSTGPNSSMFDEKSKEKLVLKAQNTETLTSGEANIASLLRMQYGHLLSTPPQIVSSKSIIGEMGTERGTNNSADRGGRFERYSGQKDFDIIQKQLQDHFRTFEILSSELRKENPRSNISYPISADEATPSLPIKVFGSLSTLEHLSPTYQSIGPSHPPTLSDSGSAGELKSPASSMSSSVDCPFERLKFQLRSQLECISSMGRGESQFSHSNGKCLEQNSMKNDVKSVMSQQIGLRVTNTVAPVAPINHDVKSVRDGLIACLLSSR